MIKSLKRLILLFIIVLSVLLVLQGYLIYTGKNNPFIGTWILSSASFQTDLPKIKSPATFKNSIQITFSSNVTFEEIPIGGKIFSFSGLAFGSGFSGVYGNSKKYLFANLRIWLDFYTKETAIQYQSIDDLMLYRDILSIILEKSTYEVHTDTLILVNGDNKLTFVKLQ